MLSVGPVILAIRALTILCWLAVIVATFPFGDFITDDAVQLMSLAALAGTCKYLAGRVARPASEVYLAGVEMGRQELLAEQRAGDGVVSLEDRRRARRRRGLRRVSGDSA